MLFKKLTSHYLSFWIHADYIVIQNLFNEMKMGMTKYKFQFIYGVSSGQQNKSKSFDHVSPVLYQ